MSAADWTSTADIKDRLRRRWQRGEILASAIRQDGFFPLRLPIKGPSSAQITTDFGAARDWIAKWRNQTAVPLEWRKFSHRLFGENEMPVAALIPTAEYAVRLLGTRREWEIFGEMIFQCRETFPELLDWMAKRAMTAIELADDWQALLSVVTWVRANPHSGVFVRQIDAAGVHTKLVERHRGVIAELLDRVLSPDAFDPDTRGPSTFNRRYGFRDKPERIRIRFLDPDCAVAPSRLGLDLTLDADRFAALDVLVERVFITENEINFLAFPSCPRSLIVFGSGYGWSALGKASWLSQCEIWYWGDIDTHGFAILDQLRARFPTVRSLLMDREILFSFRDLWTMEPNPTKVSLLRLTTDEECVYRALQAEGTFPRLEQERIPFSTLLHALNTQVVKVEEDDSVS